MDRRSILLEIANLKKELVLYRLKVSSKSLLDLKSYRLAKKQVAKLFTKLNLKEKAKNEG